MSKNKAEAAKVLKKFALLLVVLAATIKLNMVAARITEGDKPVKRA